jgi:hypothetical protein
MKLTKLLKEIKLVNNWKDKDNMYISLIRDNFDDPKEEINGQFFPFWNKYFIDDTEGDSYKYRSYIDGEYYTPEETYNLLKLYKQNPPQIEYEF